MTRRGSLDDEHEGLLHIPARSGSTNTLSLLRFSYVPGLRRGNQILARDSGLADEVS